jgi:hypothetical protein
MVIIIILHPIADGAGVRIINVKAETEPIKPDHL